MTHEAPSYPDRPREHQQRREQSREQIRRREEKDGRGRQRSNREVSERRAVPSRAHRKERDQVESAAASSTKPTPVRRDILAKLDSSVVESGNGKLSTKTWVSKTFGKAEKTGETARLDHSESRGSWETEEQRVKSRAPWYRDTAEEAAAANEKWVAVERPPVPQNTQEAAEQHGVLQIVWIGIQIKSLGFVPMLWREIVFGLVNFEAHQAEDNFELLDPGLHFQEVGLISILSPEELISPLKGLVSKAPPGTTHRITKALGVKKKIERNPFQGSRIRQHMALACMEPSKEPIVLANVSNPSSLKTGPDEGKTSKEFKDPVVDEEPSADG
ncbi:hypothetical protein AALP_AAs55588U000600 [Arabis alpina]|uniref:Uncharacterized protein n=1 Tax=Arabis alpina TaxID=50452 RepID=A0A087G278_ARAAL|nr:hypothetical protein AALP_AAs55588U000600 [Arabis alpina]